MTPEQIEAMAIRAMLGEAPVSRQSAARQSAAGQSAAGRSADTEYALDLARQEAAAQQGAVSPYQKIMRQSWIDPLTGGPGDPGPSQMTGRAVAARDAAVEKLFGSPYGEREVRRKPMAAKKHSPGYSEERNSRMEVAAEKRRVAEEKRRVAENRQKAAAEKQKEVEAARIFLPRYREGNKALFNTTDIEDWRTVLNRLKAEGYPWGNEDLNSDIIEQGLGHTTTGGRAYPNRSFEPGLPPFPDIF
jgi:hypothetical protein